MKDQLQIAYRRRPALWRAVAILLLSALALGLRLRAAAMLPIDFDEDDYLYAAEEIAGALRAGDLAALQQLNFRPEHPQLMKSAFGLVLWPLPAAEGLQDPDNPVSDPAPSLPEPQLTAARRVSVLFGTLAVTALSSINPVAGLFLAIHTFTIKYTSQVMLEGIPLLMGILTMWGFERSRVWQTGRWSRWLLLSAVALGLTAAAKYNYAIGGLAALGYWGWMWLRPEKGTERPPLARTLELIVAWGGLALLLFFAAQPFLWPDPLGRLLDSVFFHAAYPFSTHVAQVGYPVYQPFLWLTMSVPWHPQVFPIGLDLFITLLALVGLPRLAREHPLYGWWLVAGLLLLLVWPTKWPQYILIFIAPLTLSAALGVRTVAQRLAAGIVPSTEQSA